MLVPFKAFFWHQHFLHTFIPVLVQSSKFGQMASLSVAGVIMVLVCHACLVCNIIVKFVKILGNASIFVYSCALVRFHICLYHNLKISPM